VERKWIPRLRKFSTCISSYFRGFICQQVREPVPHIARCNANQATTLDVQMHDIQVIRVRQKKKIEIIFLLKKIIKPCHCSVQPLYRIRTALTGIRAPVIRVTTRMRLYGPCVVPGVHGVGGSRLVVGWQSALWSNPEGLIQSQSVIVGLLRIFNA